jgi:hypothetical protein
MSHASNYGNAADPAATLNVTTAVGVPTDRVRWGPIIAGLFAAISTLAVLAVLGAAVAGTAYDPGDSARAFGIGAGIWGAISALIAFFVGGWLSGRSAAARGHGASTLNGAMVWVTTIPLMMIVGAMVAGNAASAVGQAVQTATQATATAANGAAVATSNRPDLADQARTASAKVGDAAQQAKDQAQQAVQKATRPENQEKAADATAKGAWGTLIAMLLGLAAAAIGGYLGGGAHNRRRDVVTA